MSENQMQVLQELYRAGYAVFVFTPEELGNASPDSIMDAMHDAGDLCIAYANQFLKE